ncbi:hypothetical protein [Lentzea albida]|uniref:Uncharacterized protein n=1 Tax=Lentzea albida TaxID=65499 RepID=A0A1H9WE39_9PSEU|nr:hypothetical protein [Lentzea albida]SES32061.1 hypothetical protein SAMN04488000_1223 [Lentzea albida]
MSQDSTHTTAAAVIGDELGGLPGEVLGWTLTDGGLPGEVLGWTLTDGGLPGEVLGWTLTDGGLPGEVLGWTLTDGGLPGEVLGWTLTDGGLPAEALPVGGLLGSALPFGGLVGDEPGGAETGASTIRTATKTFSTPTTLPDARGNALMVCEAERPGQRPGRIMSRTS